MSTAYQLPWAVVAEPAEASAPPIHERGFDGTASQVGKACGWLREIAQREGVNVPPDAYLALSELTANAVIHTASGQSGGKFAAGVREHPDGLLVWVRDQGVPEGMPRAGRVPLDEYDRSLQIICEIATGWGTSTGPGWPVERISNERDPLACGGCFWCLIPSEPERRPADGGGDPVTARRLTPAQQRHVDTARVLVAACGDDYEVLAAVAGQRMGHGPSDPGELRGYALGLAVPGLRCLLGGTAGGDGS